MDKIDDVLSDVEAGKSSPEEGAERIKHGGKVIFENCCGHRQKGVRSKTSLFGVYLILQGIVVLGSVVFGWFPAQYLGSWWNLVWPVMVGVMGGGMLIRAGSRGRFSFVGTILFTLGIVRIVVNTGAIQMTAWWSWFWPVCLIAVGISIVIKSMRQKNGKGFHFDWKEFDWND